MCIRDRVGGGHLGFVQPRLEPAQSLVDLVGEAVLKLGLGEPGVQPAVQKAHQAEALVKGRLEKPLEGRRRGVTPEDLLHPVVIPVFPVEIQIGGEVLGDLGVLQVLVHHLFVHRQALILVSTDEGGEILPAAGGDELGAVHVRVDLVEVLGLSLIHI